MDDKHNKFFIGLSRKSQMEMIGLVVIVVLVITAMLFYIAYSMSNPKENVKRAYADKAVVTNMLIAMLKTNVDDCPYHDSLAELVVDCAKTNPTILCNRMSSCYIVESVSNTILFSMLPDLGRNFTFTITPARFSDGIRNNITIDNGCRIARVKGAVVIQGTQLLPVDSYGRENVKITLDICDG
jgi:hypothetical protein